MKNVRRIGAFLATTFALAAAEPLPAPWQHQDIGPAKIPGSAQHAAGFFTLGGTMDIWGPADGGHFAWQPAHGDTELVARVTAMDNPGGVAHAKASLSLRGNLAPGARQVTMCVTATDGTQLLCRAELNGPTVRVDPVKRDPGVGVPKKQFPCWLKLVRRGNEFTGYESTDGVTWYLTGKTNLGLAAEAVIGLSASSHKPDILMHATFDQVKLTTGTGGGGGKAPDNRLSRLMTMAIDGTDQRIVYESPERFEAPNWSPDGRWLVCNRQGAFFRIAAAGGGQPEPIATGDVKGVNNDHMLSPDGKTIYFSAQGHLYAVPFGGGTPRRISNDQAPERKFKYYLHGVSPDEKTLAYTGVEAVAGPAKVQSDLYTIPAAGGADTRLTQTPNPDDGPEYSPDGKWIYFNSELRAKVPGHAQVFRMRPDGSGITQLTDDERVNWFPHVSPDGQWIVYISFPPGTIGHPANRDVILRRMKTDGSARADLLAFNGGQGTINVHSWSPDSRHFAFVMYPEAK